MARKDSEKDSERPHYYSQFWLDVAAGRRVIGAPKPGEEEAEQAETETPEPISSRRAGRSGSSNHGFIDDALVASNGQTETIQHPVAEPLEEPEEYVEPEVNEEILEDDAEYQDAGLEDEDIPDMDLDLVNEDENEDFYEDEEEDDDLDWGGHGRKKSKPGRAKQPRSKPRRDTRRNS
jgi:hypothetical protein